MLLGQFEPKILFECDDISGDFGESEETQEVDSSEAERSSNLSGRGKAGENLMQWRGLL